VQLAERLARSRRTILLLSLSLLSLDQASKWWVVTNLDGHFTIFLTVFALTVTTGLIIFARKVADLRWAIGFGVLLGGVLGNLTDRIFREPQFLHGHVVDFIQLPNWPIFNVADIAITCSGFWIAYLLLRDIKPFATFGDDDE